MTSKVKIKKCVRCGESHPRVEFKEFINMPVRLPYTHWGMCPVTNEPILMYILFTQEWEC